MFWCYVSFIYLGAGRLADLERWLPYKVNYTVRFHCTATEAHS